MQLVIAPMVSVRDLMIGVTDELRFSGYLFNDYPAEQHRRYLKHIFAFTMAL